MIFKDHIWEEYKLRVWRTVTYVTLVCYWKKWNSREGTRCEECIGIEATSSGG